eukprot:PhM_4_TR10357/c6_g1_i1/m.80296
MSRRHDRRQEEQRLLQQQQQQVQIRAYDTSELDTEHAIQREKAEDIHALERDLREAHALVGDFSNMVKEQGAGITTIEDNVTRTADHVVDGTSQLKTASKHQKRGRKLMCCVLVLLIIIICVVAFYFLLK